MLISLVNASDLIGCDGDHKPIKNLLGNINQMQSYAVMQRCSCKVYSYHLHASCDPVRVLCLFHNKVYSYRLHA